MGEGGSTEDFSPHGMLVHFGIKLLFISFLLCIKIAHNIWPIPFCFATIFSQTSIYCLAFFASEPFQDQPAPFSNLLLLGSFLLLLASSLFTNAFSLLHMAIMTALTVTSLQDVYASYVQVLLFSFSIVTSNFYSFFPLWRWIVQGFSCSNAVLCTHIYNSPHFPSWDYPPLFSLGGN